nr:MFS transporter [Escherichia coli]
MNKTKGCLIANFATVPACAPVLGALSDRFGRRPVLLVSLAGAAVDYAIMATAPFLWVLYIGRIVAGITGATGAVAGAYIADITDGDERARHFGFMSACFGFGMVAATVGAVQPLMVVFISAALLGSPIRLMAVLGAICGTAGVALLVLTPNAALDPVGVAAGLAGAVSMAFGTVLTRKWQPPVPLLTFTAWQLAAGGLLLVPVALVFDPPIPMPTGTNVLGLAWLGLIGAGLTYFLWFRGISRLEPTVVSLLGFLSPGTAVLLGWLFLDQTLSALQIIGVLLVIGSIWLGQRSNRTPRARIACRKSP